MNHFGPHTTENEAVSHTVFSGLCKGCRICQQVCPQKCIELDDSERGVYNNKIVRCDVSRCIGCQKCEQSCPDRAIRVVRKRQDDVHTDKSSSPRHRT